jgi:hypothetical protein
MRDVFVSEVETEEPDEYVKQFLSGPEASLAKREEASGVIIYDIEACGLRQRLSFTPV